MKRSVVVATLGTTQTLAWGSSYYLPAILAQPIATGLGLSRATVFGVFSGSLLLAAVLGPAVGRAIDKNGGRGVLVLSNLVLGAGLILLARSQSVVGLAVAWMALGVGMALGLYDFGLCHADRSLRAGGSRPDHRNYADRRVRQHHWMAALGGARCEPGLARRLPDLGGNQSADRAAAQPLSHSTRTAARTPSRAGYRGGNGAARCDADPGFCFRRDLVCDRGDGGAHAAPS